MYKHNNNIFGRLFWAHNTELAGLSPSQILILSLTFGVFIVKTFSLISFPSTQNDCQTLKRNLTHLPIGTTRFVTMFYYNYCYCIVSKCNFCTFISMFLVQQKGTLEHMRLNNVCLDRTMQISCKDTPLKADFSLDFPFR